MGYADLAKSMLDSVAESSTTAFDKNTVVLDVLECLGLNPIGVAYYDELMSNISIKDTDDIGTIVMAVMNELRHGEFAKQIEDKPELYYENKDVDCKTVKEKKQLIGRINEMCRFDKIYNPTVSNTIMKIVWNQLQNRVITNYYVVLETFIATYYYVCTSTPNTIKDNLCKIDEVAHSFELGSDISFYYEEYHRDWNNLQVNAVINELNGDSYLFNQIDLSKFREQQMVWHKIDGNEILNFIDKFDYKFDRELIEVYRDMNYMDYPDRTYINGSVIPVLVKVYDRLDEVMHL